MVVCLVPPFDFCIYNFISDKTVSTLTLDSIDDLARYSDDGTREPDERIAGLLCHIVFNLFQSKKNSLYYHPISLMTT